MTPAEIISLLKPTVPDLTSRIGVVDKEWAAPGTHISGRFFFTKFRDGAPTIDDLIAIAHARMINFALPRSRIDEAIKEAAANPGTMDYFVALTTEARDLFIRTSEETGRSGELGEVLLYMLVEWVLKAPIVACKMYLKTSKQMPIHGTDGVHMGYENDHLVMYWGESKMHAQLSTALSDIVLSITKQIEDPKKYENEVRIVRSNLNLGDLDISAKEEIKNYFNPYKPESNKLINCYACFAGFDSSLYEDVSKHPQDKCEAEFLKLYDKRITSACDLILEKAKAAGIEHLRFSYFLLPFPSVDKARDSFQKKLWGT